MSTNIVQVFLFIFSYLSLTHAKELIFLRGSEPSVLKVDGVYYMAINGSDGDARVPLHVSTDLRSWTFVKYLFTESNLPKWLTSHKLVHAPIIKKVGDKYNLYYYGPKGPYWLIGVATAPTPAGPYVDIDEPLHSEDETSVWDPSVMEDGKIYIINLLLYYLLKVCARVCV